VLSGLASLQRHGVVTRNDHGREVVYLIQPEQRIAAAYHRNGILHFFVVPAIVDLASLEEGGPDDAGPDDAKSVHDEALALRDLFKFEFFFAEKGEFLAEVDAEVASTDRPVTAPFLRPFLEAYWATAEALAAHHEEPVGAETLADEACGLAEQFLLQARIYSADAVSSSYIDGAVRLAEHRGLLDGDVLEDGPDLAARRAEFADELHRFVRRARALQARAAARFLELMRS
jgi:glycerol-3-phosphate O-acyltransferase